MGLLKHLRSKSKAPNHEGASASYKPKKSSPARYGRDFSAKLPQKLLERILVEVCPHSQDQSYEPSERSSVSDGCMLCDLRDLAKAAQVCRKWYLVASGVLYKSVRIDAVHYCELEEVLAEKRQKKTFLKTHVVEAGDIPAIRLELFCRTVRENRTLAAEVELLKLPYMTRETCKGELARTISVLPNLRYVDLPDGAFTGDPQCAPLVHELQARCSDIRKMGYRSGSEASFELLARKVWQSLEIVELNNIAVEPSTMRLVLASLPALHELTMSDIAWLDDSIFQSSPLLPEFPALQTLSLEDTPRITAEGLISYLSRPRNREALKSLSLSNTGVDIQNLNSVMWEATHLSYLAIVETVSKSLSLSLSELPALTSICLKTLHFEITDSEDAHGLQKPASSYYAYLAQSIHENALPALSQLYVRDPDFADLLLMPPLPTAPFAADGSARHSRASFMPPRGINQELEVFSKGLDELEWVFTAVAPTSPTHNGTGSHGARAAGRPISAYSASRGLGPQWAAGGFGGEARKSVIVGNGFGGFLAVPQEETPRPMTSSGGNGYGSDGRPGSAGGKGFGGGAGSFIGSALAAAGTAAGSVAGGSGAASAAGSRGSWLKPPPSLAGSNSPSSSHTRHSSKQQDLWR